MSSAATDPFANEHRYVFGIIGLVIVLTTLPYLLAYSVSNTFVGQIYNIVDYSVYLSWTRQAADGHFASLNLFTTIKQHGYLFNALFLLLGGVVRVTGLAIPIVFQIFRIGGAALLLWLAYLFCRLAYPSSAQARLTAFGLVALSSGFGFVYWPRWININPTGVSVDVWQPEAFTFLSIYTSVLFVIATIFILTAIYNLVQGELTGKFKYAINAGLCALVLGNIHSYDILHIAAAWGLYLIVISVVERRIDTGRILRAITAGAFALPTTAYQYWVFKHDPVFHLRANTPTLSPPFFYYAMGYGLVFILAVGAIALIVLHRPKFLGLFSNNKVMICFATWAVAGLTIVYLPVEFQRKMAMGEHIPLCILAGGCAAYLAKMLPEKARAFALCLVVLLTFPTNALFLTRDFRHVVSDRSEIPDANPFLTRPQLEVLQWIRQNTEPSDAILALPPVGQFIPGYCDRAVWVGHWSETPQYGGKITKLIVKLSTATPDAVRVAFLDSTGTDYLVYPTDASSVPLHIKRRTIQLSDFADSPPPYLTRVYRTPTQYPQYPNAGGYVIFKIER
jgi:hypothetical protein